MLFSVDESKVKFVDDKLSAIAVDSRGKALFKREVYPRKKHPNQYDVFIRV